MPSSLEQEAASCKTCSDHTAALFELQLSCAVEQISLLDIPTVSLAGLKPVHSFLLPSLSLEMLHVIPAGSSWEMRAVGPRHVVAESPSLGVFESHVDVVLRERV